MSGEVKRKKSKRRKADAGINTRDQILDITERLLYEKGYMGMSLSEVAQHIGIRQAALYYYFPQGKEQLCLEVAHRSMEKDVQGFASSIASQKTATEQLKAVAQWIVSKPKRTDKVIIDMSRFVNAEHQAILGENFIKKLYLPIHNLLLWGIENGEFRRHDAAATTWLFLSMLNGLETSHAAIDTHKLATAFVETLIEGIHA
jgi:AcrR family transcriptional regulator